VPPAPTDQVRRCTVCHVPLRGAEVSTCGVRCRVALHRWRTADAVRQAKAVLTEVAALRARVAALEAETEALRQRVAEQRMLIVNLKRHR
jgi:hypothetical protein